MKIEELIQFFEENGYVRTGFFRKKLLSHNGIEETEYNILPFDYIYTDKNQTEIFILYEKNTPFIKQEIEEFDEKINAFIAFLSNNDPKKYNINLLLLCPLNIKKQKDNFEISSVLGFERSKYTCRKIFLDTASDNFKEELSIIPSFPIDVPVKLSKNDTDDLMKNVKELIKGELYQELIKERIEIKLEKILSLLDVKDEEFEQ